MKNSQLRLLGQAVVLAGLLAAFSPARAQTDTQNITLVPGWNSIWLEVEPLDAGGQSKPPEDVFTNGSIEIVATPRPLAGSAEFFAGDPAALGSTPTFNQDIWQQWKRNAAVDTNNLARIVGNRAYLVRVTGTANVPLSVTGRVRFFRPTWIPDRYNLLGFGLEGTRTFSQFFSPSNGTHPVDKVFTLSANGSWAPVTASAPMLAGRAYWIFSSGPSKYMGPVGVDFEHSITGVLDFGGPGDAVKVGNELLDLDELTFTNYGAAAASPTVTAISADAGLALFRVTPATDHLGYVRGNGITALGVSVAAGATLTTSIGAKRSFPPTDDTRHTSLYRLKAGAIGASFYLPITAVRSDLQQTAAATTGLPPSDRTGLWIGEVIVDRASSIVVNGAPIQPAAGKAPLRVVMHSDTGGTVRLLSQVTLMQTKTADPAVNGVPVLVVDPAKVPFFDGIKERNGRRVGVRIEAVAYDMPRSASAWSGADLLTFNTRPTTLQETYDFSVAMAGAIGQTVTASFSLDPFHRSNPFRHVFHQDLPKGPRITRTFTLVFDTQETADRLTGTFTDTIQGVIKDTLTLKGSVEMRRVSAVGTLE